MLVKQLSVFIENKEGHLAAITRTLKEAGIDLRALSVFDSAEFGILRMVADDPYKAETLLKDAGHVVKMMDVLAVEPEDHVGAMNAIFETLGAAGVNVEYAYFSIMRQNGHALPHVILKTSDDARAMQVLSDAGDIIAE